MLSAAQVTRLASVLVGFKQCLLYCPDGGALQSGAIEPLPTRPTTINGYLGEFDVQCKIGGTETAIGNLSQNENGKFDIVLDGINSELNDFPVAPPGYIAITDSTSAIDLQDALYTYKDGWEKPKYFAHEPSICGHTYKGKVGCDRCIHACPTGAITSTPQGIHINPNLCRGCGECSVVCPSGAMRYRYPDPKLLLEGLHLAMHAFKAKSDQSPHLLLTEHNFDDQQLAQLPENLIPLSLHSIASVDISLVLTALASGWLSVLFDMDGYYPDHQSDVLSQQQVLAEAILGKEEASKRIRHVDSRQGIKLDSTESDRLPSLGHPHPLAYRGWPANKRALLRSAIQRINLPIREMTPATLAKGAPFGDVVVEAEKCTRCFSCVQICPVDALKIEEGALAFIEKDCMQCGLCVEGCPESVMTLNPRFAPKALLSDQPIEKASAAELVPCVECGHPFISSILLASLEDKMKEAGVPLDYLKVCPECRGKNTLGAQIIHREVD